MTSIIELQKIDCNCNDCINMVRDIEKLRSFDYLYKGMEKASHRIHYGRCLEARITVSFIPNTFQIDTQNCFKHRREN